MKFLSLVAACFIATWCVVGSTEAFGRECSPKGEVSLVAPPMGRATLVAPITPIPVQAETDITSMTSRVVRGFDYNHGQFTAQQEGTYSVDYLIKMRAKAGLEGNFITVALVLNDVACSTMNLLYAADPDNVQYPAKFTGRKRVTLDLKQGDTLSLRIGELSLVDGAEPAFVKSTEHEREALAGLFIRISYSQTSR